MYQIDFQRPISIYFCGIGGNGRQDPAFSLGVGRQVFLENRDERHSRGDAAQSFAGGAGWALFAVCDAYDVRTNCRRSILYLFRYLEDQVFSFVCCLAKTVP